MDFEEVRERERIRRENLCFTPLIGLTFENEL